ncbi:hypothetical protein, partial [Ectothiorhodospira variabilis]|uniref:hypothetical protein n=1 Tax=Ectothiorhodospira variabilis TaxID=505694 RepID=UPI001EFBB434
EPEGTGTLDLLTQLSADYRPDRLPSSTFPQGPEPENHRQPLISLNIWLQHTNNRQEPFSAHHRSTERSMKELPSGC